MDFGLATAVAGGVGAVGNLVSGILSGNKNIKAIEAANKANKELADYQYGLNLDMWNRQNEYNSPVQQIQRLKEAGLNPNLMYSQGDVGNAGSAPSYDAPNMQSYTGLQDFGVGRASQELMQGLMGYAQIKKTEAETANIRQNTQNLEVQKQLNELNVIQQGYMNSKSKVEADIWRDLYQSKLANIDSSTINNISSAQQKDSSRFFTDAQRQRFEILTPIVEQQVKVDLAQKLFDYEYISPAKLQNLYADSRYKTIISNLTEIKSHILQNDLEFSNEQNKYVSERAINELQLQRYKVQIGEAERDLKKLLKEKGIKPGMSVQQAIVALFAMPWFGND